MHENKIAHLGFIQDVIARMAGNSLALKGYAMALGVGVIALMTVSNSANSILILASSVFVCVLWVMDAKYLRLERQYRILYDGVRNNIKVNDNDIELFSMNPSPFSSQVKSLFRTVFSWSVAGFYIGLIVILGLASYLIYSGC